MVNLRGSASIARGASTFIGVASKRNAIRVLVMQASFQYPNPAENAHKGNIKCTVCARLVQRGVFDRTEHRIAYRASQAAARMKRGSIARTAFPVALHLRGEHRAQNVPLANTARCVQPEHDDVNRAPLAAFSLILGCQDHASARAAQPESTHTVLMGRTHVHPSRALLVSMENSCRSAKRVQWVAHAQGGPCIRAHVASSRVMLAVQGV